MFPHPGASGLAGSLPRSGYRQTYKLAESRANRELASSGGSEVAQGLEDSLTRSLAQGLEDTLARSLARSGA